MEKIKKLSQMTTKLVISSNPPTFFCEIYILAKPMRHISYIPSDCKNKALAIVHIDLIKPIIPTRYDGSKYCLFLTNDTTRAMTSELFKTKVQFKEAISRYINYMKW